jgi:ZIP family zinc transporter
MLMSIAGGGLFAVTLQTVVPEGFEGSNDWISILGCLGFFVIFTLSHLGGQPALI